MQLKWNNGVWKIFDTWKYKDIAIFDLKREAEDYLIGLRQCEASNKSISI